MGSNSFMEKIKNKKYNFVRNWLKKSMTCFSGNVVETDKELICYVDKRKIRKDRDEYKILCLGRNISETLALRYNLEKQVSYVIDGINFDKARAHIFGDDNSNVIIKNCKFESGLHVNVYGKCLLENNYVSAVNYLPIDADELTIKNMHIKNQIWHPYSNLLVSLGSDKKIEIIDSIIGETDNKTNIEIRNPKELKLVNSKIIGYDSVSIASDKMIYDDKSSATILRTIPKLSSVVIFDGSIQKENDDFGVEKEPLEKISEKRQELIEVLREVSDKCKIANDEILESLEDKLNNQTVGKSLKRK